MLTGKRLSTSWRSTVFHQSSEYIPEDLTLQN